MIKNLEKISINAIYFICMVLFSVLTIISLCFTRYFVEDYSTEAPLLHSQGILFVLLGALLLGTIILLAGEWITSVPEKTEQRLHVLLAVVLSWMVFAGCIWVMLAESTPVYDQKLISTSAERFMQGNYGRLEYGKYLYYYPFQLGLVAYEELVFRLFGVNNYVALQMINVLGVAGSVYAGYCITRYLFSDKKAAVYYLLLSGTCFSLMIYSVYLYGDVLAIFLSVFTVWQFLRYVKKNKTSSLFYMAAAMAVAVLLRSNCWIILIAIACVIVVKVIAQKQWKYLLCILLMAACVVSGRQGLNKYYEARSGIEINDGMPSVLWIAMGMQEGDKEAGWYNGYSFYTYQDVCKFHGPTAAELGKAEIRARAKEFLKDPAYALDFYYRKFSSQWAEPTCGCFIMTYATEAERSELGKSLYTGTINKWLERFMDSYQLLIYGMVLVYLWLTRKEKPALENYILLIAIIGGVLFHMIWEAKSRYVLPYFVMMLPMAGAGLAQISGKLGKWRRKDETVETGR